MEKLLTTEQAFRAMYYFLENEYKLTQIDEILSLLSSLDWTTFSFPGPADPGTWNEWLDAVNMALERNENVSPN